MALIHRHTVRVLITVIILLFLLWIGARLSNAASNDDLESYLGIGRAPVLELAI